MDVMMCRAYSALPRGVCRFHFRIWDYSHAEVYNWMTIQISFWYETTKIDINQIRSSTKDLFTLPFIKIAVRS